MRSLHAVAVKGDLGRGRELWPKIWSIHSFLEEGNYASAVKSGMEILGWSTGGLRKTFALLEPDQVERFVGLLEAASVPVIELGDGKPFPTNISID